MKAFFKKMIEENPGLVLVLGTCPTLGVSTSVENGIGMGLATTAVLTCSNFIISLLRKFIPDKARIASYIVIIAGFTTAVEMALNAYVPVLANSLGVYIPLIVVNCILLARAESFASKNPPVSSIVDGLCMGLGFTGALIIISSVREILGSGTWLGFHVLGEWFKPMTMFVSPPGGFIVFGLVLAVVSIIKQKRGLKNG